MKSLTLAVLLAVSTYGWAQVPKADCIDLSKAKVLSATCESTDCFKIQFSCPFEKYGIRIFNRWGNEMGKFESGMLGDVNAYMLRLPKDDKFTTGIYVFTVYGIRGKIEEEEMGNFTLVK